MIAREKGAHLPEHFLFPHRADHEGEGADPTRHMGSYRKGWNGLRQEAAKKFPHLATVRRYDLRHSDGSIMCENPNMDQATLKKIFGHGPGSQLLLDLYFHATRERKEQAVAPLNGITRPPVQPASYLTLGTWSFALSRK